MHYRQRERRIWRIHYRTQGMIIAAVAGNTAACVLSRTIPPMIVSGCAGLAVIALALIWQRISLDDLLASAWEERQ